MWGGDPHTGAYGRTQPHNKDQPGGLFSQVTGLISLGGR
jgi:hypothetical protein